MTFIVSSSWPASNPAPYTSSISFICFTSSRTLLPGIISFDSPYTFVSSLVSVTSYSLHIALTPTLFSNFCAHSVSPASSSIFLFSLSHFSLSLTSKVQETFMMNAMQLRRYLSLTLLAVGALFVSLLNLTLGTWNADAGVSSLADSLAKGKGGNLNGLSTDYHHPTVFPGEATQLLAPRIKEQHHESLSLSSHPQPYPPPQHTPSTPPQHQPPPTPTHTPHKLHTL